MTDAESMALCAICYCIGRRSYIVSDGCRCPTLRVEVRGDVMRTEWAITGPRPEVEGLLRNINRGFGYG